MSRKKTNERLKELKQQVWQRRKKRIKLVFIFAVAAVVIFAAVNAKRLLTSVFWDIKTFGIRDVRITPYGARPLITGLMEIETGKSLLFLDIDALRTQIMRIREIEDCTVRKIYPATVEINAIFRKPWVMLEKGTNIVFVDRNGKILDAPDNAENLIRASGINTDAGGIIGEDAWKLEVLKEIEKCYNSNNLQRYFNLDNIRIIKPTQIILNESAGLRKIITVSEDLAVRFEQLRAVIEECKKNEMEWEYIDLRFEHPYVKHSESKANTVK